MANEFDGDVRIQGNLALVGDDSKITTPILRDWLAQEPLVRFPIRLTDFRTHDTLQPLANSASGNNLAIVGGTYGTDGVNLSAGDVHAAGVVTRRARAVVPLPAEYVGGQQINVKVAGATKTNAADTYCTVAVEAWKINRDSLVTGSQLVTTSAAAINSTTFAEKTFVLNSASLQPGDLLDIRVTIAVDDGAGGAAVTPTIASVDLLLNIKG